MLFLEKSSLVLAERPRHQFPQLVEQLYARLDHRRTVNRLIIVCLPWISISGLIQELREQPMVLR